jgi:glycoside/pentoside/hexuronide:cation symporter, GPH family
VLVISIPAMPPLNFAAKLAYGFGQLAEGLKNGAMNTFVVFYYSQVLGMPATLAGLAVGTALLVDAITDPLAGSLSDHWRSKWGRRHPFMLFSMVPLAICFFLLFAPPVSGDWALFVWLVIFTNLTRTAMTFYHVAHLALGAELTTDFSGRVSLVGFRMFFNQLGAIAATMIGFQFFFAASAEFPVGQLDPSTYAPFAATLAGLMVVSIFWSAWGTRQFIPMLPKAIEEATVGVIGVLVRTFADMRLALRQASFRWLFSGVLMVFLMIGTNAALDLYMYTYFWELSSSQVVLLMPSYVIGVAIGGLIGPAFQRRFGKRNGLLFGTAWWAGLQVLPIMLRLLGWFPENSDALLLPLLIGLRVIQAVGAMQANLAFGSALADVADENELATGRRQEGIFFSTSSFSTKFASGMGSFIAGIALDIISWPRGQAIRSGADVPPETITHLGLVYGPLVLAFSLLTMWCYSHYRLDRKRHAEILAELERRRALAS